MTLSEAATYFLTEEHPSAPEACSWVPQRGAQLGNCSFFLDLNTFPEGLVFGDLACDGYEPWLQQSNGEQYFRRVGADYQRVNVQRGTRRTLLKVEQVEGDDCWDLVIKERRARKEHDGSALTRKLHVVEDPEKQLLRQYGAILAYTWTRGPIADFPLRPHGNSRRELAMERAYRRTAPSTLQRAREKIEDEQGLIGKRLVYEEVNQEVLTETDGGLAAPLTPAGLLRNAGQVGWRRGKRRRKVNDEQSRGLTQRRQNGQNRDN